MTGKMKPHEVDARMALADKIDKLMHAVIEAEFVDRSHRFYTCHQGAETLQHLTPGDAVDEFLGDLPEGTEPPAEVTVYRYAPVDPGLTTSRVVDGLLEELDDELGDPDGFGTEATPLMRAAEELLVEVFKRQYKPYACVEVGHFQMATGVGDEG